MPGSCLAFASFLACPSCLRRPQGHRPRDACHRTAACPRACCRRRRAPCVRRQASLRRSFLQSGSRAAPGHGPAPCAARAFRGRGRHPSRRHGPSIACGIGFSSPAPARRIFHRPARAS